MKAIVGGGLYNDHFKTWLRRPLRRPIRRTGASSLLQARVPARKIIPGALATSYHIPTVTFDQGRGVALSLVGGLVSLAIVWKYVGAMGSPLRLVLAFSAAPLLFRAAGWVMSCFDQPYRADPKALEGLRVVVSIPAFNESPEAVDACLFALVNQTRPPELVDFVDDGSHKVDYTELRKYWEGQHGNTEITWTRKANEGKRRAHAVTFRSELETYSENPSKTIFVTVDSDTVLSPSAMEEGLQRFADPTVMSVAGTELGYNHDRNFLTMIQNSMQQYSQVVISGAWSVSGDMFTNRGPFALIRASAFQPVMDVYADETFYGRHVRLGDDSLTALAGSMAGKSVQQISAVAFTMWPEKLSHHSRQRTRWARGRTVRNFWRLKYLPLSSYMWWYTAASVYSFIVGFALLLIVIGTWPHSEAIAWRVIFASVVLGWVSQLRVLAFRRSDETKMVRFLTVALRPIASLWSAIVLTRIIRLYGTVTFLKQGWTTRQNGVEDTMRPQEATH
jgi:hyaluronan synthase